MTTDLHHAVRDGDTARIATLIEAGADPNARNENGLTPLHTAAIRGTLAGLTALIEAGAEPDARDEHGDAPLHKAVWGDRPEAAAALIELGADLEARDGEGWTPLHVAVLFDKTAAAARLIDLGADPNARGGWNETPLEVAQDASDGKGQLVELLRDAAADPDRPVSAHHPLHHAVWNEDAGEIRCLTQAGADVGAKDRGGEAPLHLAARLGMGEAAGLLTCLGADPDAWNDAGETPLHVAVRFDKPGVIRTLLDAGGNPDAKGRHGQTPLELARAALEAKDRMVKLLLEAGGSETPPVGPAPAPRRSVMARLAAALTVRAHGETAKAPLRDGLDKAARIVSQMEAATVRQQQEDDTPGLLRLKPSQLASLVKGAGWVVIVLLGGIGISGILG